MHTKITAVIIVILIVIGLLYFLPANPNEPKPEPVFCTLDALMCPDGSGVGRGGPNCEFKACAYTGPYTGVLQLSPAGDYQLVMGSLEEVPGEVRYVMPLELRTTNVVAQFLNKAVQVTGEFTTGNRLKVENLELASPTLGDNQIQIEVGASAEINGLKVTLNKIVEDSRCPIDVQCIQAGQLVAEVTLKAGLEEQTVNLRSDAEPYVFSAFTTQIVGIDPPRFANSVPPQGDYLLTFEVIPTSQ